LWINSPQKPKSLLQNYDVPALGPTDTNDQCIIQLEKMNHRRAPELGKLKSVLENSTHVDLAADKKNLIDHFKMTLELQNLSKQCIDKFLLKPNDRISPNDNDEQRERFSTAVEDFEKVNLMQKDVLHLLCSAPLNIPAADLELKKAANSNNNALALKFVKDHFLFSTGLALSTASFLTPNRFLNLFGLNSYLFSIGVPLSFIVGGCYFDSPQKTLDDAKKATWETTKSLVESYAASSIILGPAFAGWAWMANKPWLAGSLLVGHGLAFGVQLYRNNKTAAIKEANDFLKKQATAVAEATKSYLRNGLVTGLGTAAMFGLAADSRHLAYAVYGAHVLAASVMKLTD
jgi:hypothetical protein